MSQQCAAFEVAGPYVRGVLDYVDCQTVNLAEQGYKAIGAGTQFAHALDGLLVIAVAFFGYRMLMGVAVPLREGAVLVVKIGFVIALAQHWSAYQTVVFNSATSAPQLLAGDLLGVGSSRGGAESALLNRVEEVDGAIGLVLHPERAGAPLASVPLLGQSATGPDAGNRAGPEIDPNTRELLTSSNNILLLTVLGSEVGTRLALAILLALAPLFIATLLFSHARGFFGGWVRALVGTLLALIAVPILLAFELAIVEPQSSALMRSFSAGTGLGALPERLWVTSSLFAIAMVLLMLLVVRAAATIRFAKFERILVDRWPLAVSLESPQPAVLAGHPSVPAVRDHAQRIADAAQSTQRREELATSITSSTRFVERQRESRAWADRSRTQQQAQAFRAASGRQSAAARRRDEN